MNSRDYKIFRSGHYYHIYNRGHNKNLIFIDRQDYLNFLKRLTILLSIKVASFKTFLQPIKKDSFSIIAYCLMPNHFHILIKQNSDVSITVLMEKLGTSYAKYFNHRHNRIGSIFQDTFKAKLVENDSYLTYLSAYIHNNPEIPLRYEFSSIKEYVEDNQQFLCNTEILLKYFNNDRKEYVDFVVGYDFRQHQIISHLTFDN